MGFDIVHYNLHKIFSQPHGGGGPGGGLVAVRKTIAPYFLPAPTVVRDGDASGLADHDRLEVDRRVQGFADCSWCSTARTRTCARTPRATRMSEAAVLNANYLLAWLRDAQYGLPYDCHCMHEFVLSARKLKRGAWDHGPHVAKRLMDYGIHPPTIYFPLVVPEALMIG